MPFTIRRVRIDRNGYGDTGTYWGVGKRLYYSPEVAILRENVQVYFREEAFVRADSPKEARDIFKAAVARMLPKQYSNFGM